MWPAGKRRSRAGTALGAELVAGSGGPAGREKSIITSRALSSTGDGHPLDIRPGDHPEETKTEIPVPTPLESVLAAALDSKASAAYHRIAP